VVVDVKMGILKFIVSVDGSIRLELDQFFRKESYYISNVILEIVNKMKDEVPKVLLNKWLEIKPEVSRFTKKGKIYLIHVMFAFYVCFRKLNGEFG
jgi:hypothetical protein